MLPTSVLSVRKRSVEYFSAADKSPSGATSHRRATAFGAKSFALFALSTTRKPHKLHATYLAHELAAICGMSSKQSPAGSGSPS